MEDPAVLSVLEQIRDGVNALPERLGRYLARESQTPLQTVGSLSGRGGWDQPGGSAPSAPVQPSSGGGTPWVTSGGQASPGDSGQQGYGNAQTVNQLQNVVNQLQNVVNQFRGKMGEPPDEEGGAASGAKKRSPRRGGRGRKKKAAAATKPVDVPPDEEPVAVTSDEPAEEGASVIPEEVAERPQRSKVTMLDDPNAEIPDETGKGKGGGESVRGQAKVPVGGSPPGVGGQKTVEHFEDFVGPRGGRRKRPVLDDNEKQVITVIPKAREHVPSGPNIALHPDLFTAEEKALAKQHREERLARAKEDADDVEDEAVTGQTVRTESDDVKANTDATERNTKALEKVAEKLVGGGGTKHGSPPPAKEGEKGAAPPSSKQIPNDPG